MGTNRGETDPKHIANIAVAAPLGDERTNLFFTDGQIIVLRRGPQERPT
jgi:hypothetical protein